MNITTTLINTDKGTPKIVAKGAGKQRTTNYDHALSHDANHGTAAGVLGLVLGLTWDDSIVHVTDNGRKHSFTFPV